MNFRRFQIAVLLLTMFAVMTNSVCIAACVASSTHTAPPCHKQSAPAPDHKVCSHAYVVDAERTLHTLAPASVPQHIALLIVHELTGEWVAVSSYSPPQGPASTSSVLRL